MQDITLMRRQFLGRAGAVAAAVAARPVLANEDLGRAGASDDATSVSESHPHDRVALLCFLRRTTAYG
jgi:hypothetical protein